MNKKPLLRDLIIIGLSILVAVLIKETGVLPPLLLAAQKMKFLGNFLAGMFFVSVFTFAPALVALTEIVKTSSPVVVSFYGAAGALLGDFLIFRFIRDSLSENLLYLIKRKRVDRLSFSLKSRPLGWLGPLVGAIIIASPLPDEIGIALMGFSKLKSSIFVPLSFILNFLGILAIVSAAKYLF